MESAVPESFLGQIRAELTRLQEARPGGDIAPAPFSGSVTRRLFDLLNDGDVWQKVAIHPWVMAQCDNRKTSCWAFTLSG